jgi:hypothetical protein
MAISQGGCAFGVQLAATLHTVSVGTASHDALADLRITVTH